MSTFKELIYMVADLAKQISDDDTLNNNHIAFLLKKYRSYLLKQKYQNATQEIPISNYQTSCAKLEETSESALANCCGNKCSTSYGFTILHSENPVTYPLTFSDTKVSLLRCAGFFTLQLDSFLQYTGDLNTGAFATQERYDEFIDYCENTLGLKDFERCIGGDMRSHYDTTCKEDAKDLVALIVSKFQEADGYITVILEETPQECNPEAMYDAAMRSYGNVTMVNRERFPYVGLSKYSNKNVYGTIGIDGKLYLKAKEDISIYNKAFVTSIFEDPEKAYEQSSCTYNIGTEQEPIIKHCPEGNEVCDPWDREFPIEGALQTMLINLTLKDILGAAYRPFDSTNDAKDNLADQEAFIRRNMKQQYVAQQQPQNVEE